MSITGLGTAVPNARYTQKGCWDSAKSADQIRRLTPRSQALLRKVLLGDNGVESRYLVLKSLDEVFEMNPDVLHRRFAAHAPALAIAAAHRALENSTTDPLDLDAVVVSLSVLPGPSRSVLEIGAGDGTLLLRIARRLPPDWRGVRLQLLDQQDVVGPKTLADLARLGWQAQTIKADVFNGLEVVRQVQLVIANLFLHHFDDARLKELFEKVRDGTRVFAACEPRRFTRPRLAGGLVWLLGGNSVTRHDAVASVRAGFRDRELSAL